MRAVLLAFALTACTDVDSVSEDLIGEQFGQVYDCTMTESYGYPVENTVYAFRPCLVDVAEVYAFEREWIDNTCAPDINAKGVLGTCKASCPLAALGVDVCSP
jgi:hypothetical protein